MDAVNINYPGFQLIQTALTFQWVANLQAEEDADAIRRKALMYESECRAAQVNAEVHAWATSEIGIKALEELQMRDDQI